MAESINHLDTARSLGFFKDVLKWQFNGIYLYAATSKIEQIYKKPPEYFIVDPRQIIIKEFTFTKWDAFWCFDC